MGFGGSLAVATVAADLGGSIEENFYFCVGEDSGADCRGLP